MHPPTGFVPPPYPQDRLASLRAIADALPGGVVDASVGTPVDPMPEVVAEALIAATRAATGYPPSIGTPGYRESAAGWVERRFGVPLTPDQVIACIGTNACEDITCGTGRCAITCEGSRACQQIDCTESCSCDVACNTVTACAAATVDCPPQCDTAPGGCEGDSATCDRCE